MRLLSCSIVILAGAVSLGLSGTGERYSGAPAEEMGYFLLTVGGLIFTIEYFRSWSGAGSNALAQARIDEAKSLPKQIDFPQ